MSVLFRRRIGELDKGWVLSPERYDPRRQVASSATCALGTW
jgi:hypothetical protein